MTVTYRRLGASGLHVFPLGLGTMQFGWSTDESASFEVLDAYHEAGGNFVDTADVYSSWAPGNAGGVSEEIIGRWIADRGVRDQVVLATKVRYAMGDGFSQGRDTVHQREGLSRRWIIQACEDSLRRLQTDHIDLYQAHGIDPHTPIDETLSAFDDLIRRGLVRYIGCSNFSAWRLMQALWTADVRGLTPFVSIQPEYSLLAPTRADFERELAPVCLEYGVGVVPYSPLGGGLLTGKYRRDGELPDSVRADENAERLTEQNLDTIETLVAVARRREATPAQAALAWLLAKPWVTAPIVGANRVDQLDDTLEALDVALTDDDIADLDAASSWQRSRTEREE